jgi:hypothetical protein
MPIRHQISDLISAGGLRSEDASHDEITKAQYLLEWIAEAVSDEEAPALAIAFGPDDCDGLAWAVLHLIETASRATTAQYPVESRRFGAAPPPPRLWRARNRRPDENLGATNRVSPCGGR